jgi:hypothetical protein
MGADNPRIKTSKNTYKSDETKQAAKTGIFIHRNLPIIQQIGAEMVSVAGRFRLIEVPYVLILGTVKTFHCRHF